jgi:hypothetical protein
MMVALLITFCLSASPDRCVERADFDAMAGLPQCMIAGQQAGAEWTKQHPQWVMRGFRCRMGGAVQKEA